MKNLTTNPAGGSTASTRERVAADAVVAAYIHEISLAATQSDGSAEPAAPQPAFARSNP